MLSIAALGAGDYESEAEGEARRRKHHLRRHLDLRVGAQELITDHAPLVELVVIALLAVLPGDVEFARATGEILPDDLEVGDRRRPAVRAAVQRLTGGQDGDELRRHRAGRRSERAG